MLHNSIPAFVFPNPVIVIIPGLIKKYIRKLEKMNAGYLNCIVKLKNIERNFTTREWAGANLENTRKEFIKWRVRSGSWLKETED